MIQPQELREGNWVICFDPKKNITPKEFPCQISWRHLRSLNIDRNNCEYTPIPLTADLLAACNWKPKENPDIFYHPIFGDAPDTVVLKKKEGSYCMVILRYDYYVGEPMHYLHQLQNRFYSFCNEELAIDLKVPIEPLLNGEPV